MTTKATGPFEVTLTPEPPPTPSNSSGVARMTLDKRYHGDLEATSSGHMLAVRSEVPGSAGYVAMERVSGKLHGRSGTFVLQHSSTLTRGAAKQSVTIVPDSGTAELVGLSGEMVIHIVEGKHSYELDYSLA